VSNGERGSETVLLINARTEGGKTMSVQQIEAVAQAFADAFNHGESPAVDVAAVAELLDEDLEVFDTVPYRFDNKKGRVPAHCG
jgi:ketosteroid isomerase-like protein